MNNNTFYPGEIARLQALNLIPVNEDDRIKALTQYNILDTPEEPAYDELVKLAAYICKTPIAAISLIDHDRQWFKSKIGLNLSQTPRGDSFCAYAIMNPKQVMAINDAGIDPRFADHRLVNNEPHARFYAGAPLNTASGETLGTLCVLDHKPHTLWQKTQEELLQSLSRQVIAQMELRKARSVYKQHLKEQIDTHTKLKECQKQLERAHAELKTLNTTDPLTGVKNRRAFDQLLRYEYRRASRYRAPLSLMMIDIDRFKAFNDEYGKLEGDRVLQRLAHILQSIVRNCDLVARYGGEEFTVILPETDRDSAMTIAERLCEVVEKTAWPIRSVTISIGVATASAEYDHIMLVQRTDKALYQAKQAGRNRVVHVEDIKL